MTTPLEAGARHVLEIELSGTASSGTDVAAAIVRAWEQLGRHIARLVGTDGIRTILGRSVILARTQFAWLESEPRTTAPTATSWPSLERSLAQQPPERAIAAFVCWRSWSSCSAASSAPTSSRVCSTRSGPRRPGLA